MPGFDLHVHTTASDGACSSAEIIRLAADIGLEGIAITDHDTTQGLAGADEMARAAGITVIPGVELSTDFDGREIHILGYYLNDELEMVQDKLTGMQNSRLKRICRMVERINRLGYKLSVCDVLALSGRGSVGRPHIARAMLEKGHVRTLQEAFQRFIGHGKPAYVPRDKFSPGEAVHFILAAGGIPVMAHPGLSKANSLIAPLAEQGLAGIEVYHPDHSPAAEMKFLQLARDHHLLATGGSDFHGINKSTSFALGCRTVDKQVVAEMAAWRKRR